MAGEIKEDGSDLARTKVAEDVAIKEVQDEKAAFIATGKTKGRANKKKLKAFDELLEQIKENHGYEVIRGSIELQPDPKASFFENKTYVHIDHASDGHSTMFLSMPVLMPSFPMTIKSSIIIDGKEYGAEQVPVFTGRNKRSEIPEPVEVSKLTGEISVGGWASNKVKIDSPIVAAAILEANEEVVKGKFTQEEALKIMAVHGLLKEATKGNAQGAHVTLNDIQTQQLLVACSELKNEGKRGF